MQYLLTMNKNSKIAHTRIKALIESVLKEEYSADQVKKILWDSFKEYADNIEVQSTDADKIVFKITVNDSFNTEVANDVLTDLHDSELFDVVNNLDGTVTVTFFQHGVDNKYKDWGHQIYASAVHSEIVGAHGIPSYHISTDRSFTIQPNQMIDEVLKFSGTEDFGLIVKNDNTVVVASVPSRQTELFYSSMPLDNAFFDAYLKGKLESEFKPMNIVEMQKWATQEAIKEDGVPTMQMGVTAFGKAEDGKYNQDSLTDTIMEDNKNGGISDAELRMIESLAEIEHEQWKQWASDLMESEPNISAKRLERWKSYMVPYASLPNEIKEKDREYAKKSLDVLKAYLKQRIAEKNNPAGGQ